MMHGIRYKYWLRSQQLQSGAWGREISDDALQLWICGQLVVSGALDRDVCVITRLCPVLCWQFPAW